MKTFIVIAFATLSTAIGESLISVAMKEIGDVSGIQWSQLPQFFGMVANAKLFLGICFMAVFFVLYSAALSWADLSFTQPLTALTFVFGTLIARYFLQEQVSAWRWCGTCFIVLGVALVSMDKRELTVPTGNRLAPSSSTEPQAKAATR